MLLFQRALCVPGLLARSGGCPSNSLTSEAGSEFLPPPSALSWPLLGDTEAGLGMQLMVPAGQAGRVQGSSGEGFPQLHSLERPLKDCI